MRSDMWRLYRHVLIGGVLISLVCFAVIEWLQKNYHQRHLSQQLLADVELTAQLYRMNNSVLPTLSTASFYTWKPLGSVSDSPDLRFEQTLEEGAGYASVYDGDSLVLAGELQWQRLQSVQPLLQRFLLSDLALAEKLQLLNGLSNIVVTQIQAPSWRAGEVSYSQAPDQDAAFVWQPDASDKAWRVEVLQKSSLSIGVTVLLFIVLSISALLVIVWIEFLGLDRKRLHFETVTRQIARGRGTLPQGVVDSSGTLKELAYSFDSMSTHIQRLLKVQREMINAISHELRTPIARLRFGLEVLKDDVTEELEHSISALEYDVEELNTLVDEVLTYGKLEEGTLALNFERASIRQILEGIVEHNHALLQKYDVQVTVNGDEWVNADAHHLHRALQNLILNASKYANSTIAITFTEDEERWQVDIEDDGRGIPEEDRDKVFIPFQRLDNSRTRASGGYGLGLAIVQRIAFWHGGAVLIEGSELGGAKFSFIWSRSQHQNSLG